MDEQPRDAHRQRTFRRSQRRGEAGGPARQLDCATLDAVFELMVRGGRSAPMAKAMMLPEAWTARGAIAGHATCYSYCNAVMEPWDGPAALAPTDGAWVLAAMDRNGLRPLRDAGTKDGLIVAGSEAGMARRDRERDRRGRSARARTDDGVELASGPALSRGDIKDRSAASRPYGDWVKNITVLDPLIEAEAPSRAALSATTCAAARSPPAGPSKIGSSSSTPWPGRQGSRRLHGRRHAACGALGQYRPINHFFRQNFNQVTNPPIDPLREPG